MNRPIYLTNSLVILGISLVLFFGSGKPPETDVAIASIVAFGIALGFAFAWALTERPAAPDWQQVKGMQRALISRLFS